MKFEYYCTECGTITAAIITVADKPADWSPEESVQCACGKPAIRTFGCNVSMQENRDQLQHVGSSLSNQRGIEFSGKGFPDVERKLDAEQKEISSIMDEPVTRHDVEAGYEQMAQLEDERGKPKGFYSGKREQVEVSAEIDGKIVTKQLDKKRGADALKHDAEKARVARGM